MKLNNCLVAIQFAALAAAWLPWERPYGLFSASNDTISSNSTTSSNSTISGEHRSFKDRRYLPNVNKIRGVNLGSLFIVEPWMASNEWSNMGCGSAYSEFDCTVALGQTQANKVFAEHWSTWITASDLAEMVSYGLNTIRIPLGYWIFEDIVYSDSEHFPQGQIPYLETLCQEATNLGLYIILDLHGAPGAQVAEQPFTGQYAPTAGFYQTYQYERAYQWLTEMTQLIYANPAFKGVGMIEIVNEPISGQSSLVDEYYPNALAAVRAVESSLQIADSELLHIQMMDNRWGAGNPDEALTDLYLAAYDDHSYEKYDSSINPSQSDYLSATCSLSVSSNYPEIVGEWSISPADETSSSLTDSDANKQFFTNWWSAQVQVYEQQEGWVFWSWKTNLNDYRWDYQLAVKSGVIPTNIDDAYNFNCADYKK